MEMPKGWAINNCGQHGRAARAVSWTSGSRPKQDARCMLAASRTNLEDGVET